LLPAAQSEGVRTVNGRESICRQNRIDATRGAAQARNSCPANKR
jgi:hypothetical protein